MIDISNLLREQQSYYDFRSHDWDQWVRHYMLPVQEELDALIAQSPLMGDVLEMACGTGFWTERLALRASSVTALDGSEEMLLRVQARSLPNVHTVRADLFSWHPPTQWDAIFFAHWLAHVPSSHFDAFWSTVDAALLPGGHVVVIDVSSAEKRIEEELRQDQDVPLARRRLKDGRRFDVVKRYWEPDELLQRLKPLGWTGTATAVGKDRGFGFVYYELHRDSQ
jgi:trans-aconitate methyltransferase